MTLWKSKTVRKNSWSKGKKKFTWEYLWLTFTFPPDSFLTASCPQSDTLPARHCHLLGDSLSAPWLCLENLSLSLSHSCLPSPLLPAWSLCWRWQLIPGPSFILPMANFGENKTPVLLISLEGLQIEFSPSQCPLSWLSLGSRGWALAETQRPANWIWDAVVLTGQGR